jgi:acyl-CoA synthetase (AMP-forming)/AMP-acid ligase II
MQPFLRPPGSTGVALVDADAGIALSYPDLERHLAEAGTHFEAPRKSLVFLFCNNALSSVLAYLAAVEQGHAVALLDANLDPSLKARLLECYRPRFVWAPDSTALPESRAQVSRWGGGGSWRSDAADAVIHPDLAVLLSTSGTTGSPKLVRLSRKAVESNARSIARGLGISSQERAITSLPLFYSYGLSVLNSHLCAGATTVLTNAGPVERHFWDTLRKHECSSFAGVPYTYQLLHRLGFEKFDLPTLRVMTQAGGRLEPRLIQRFSELMSMRGGKFFVMYGQTEAAARMTILPADRLPEKLGSVGCAVTGGELTIATDVAAGGPHSGTGEVVYRGANVMLGYAESLEDLERGDELGGELHTGDLGYLDADGMLFITGRSKRIAKVFGLRVSLDEVEDMVRERGPAAVIDGGDGLLVFCTFGDDTTLQALRMDLAQRLRVHHSGLELRRVESLPISANGKIDYKRLSA